MWQMIDGGERKQADRYTHKCKAHSPTLLHKILATDLSGTYYEPILQVKILRCWQVQGLWKAFPPRHLAGVGLESTSLSPAPVPSEMAPLSLFLCQAYTYLIFFVFLQCLGQQKGWLCTSKGWDRCEFWRGHGLATLALCLCMEITHRCGAFDTSKILSPLEFCSLQAARSAGALAPSLPPGTLEGAEILGSQIKAKGSIWLWRKEGTVWRCGWKTLLWVSGSGLLVPRMWISLH